MRIYRTLTLGLALAAPLAFVGCDETSKVKDEQVIKTPGGKTTIETEKTITTEGDHKDAPVVAPVPAGDPAPR